MYCRSRPQYRSDLGWISGVAFLGTLTRSARPVQALHLRSVLQHASGFFPTRPRGARAWASHDGDPCMQLPSARGCYQLAPQRTSTSNPVPMPGTPSSRSFADTSRGEGTSPFEECRGTSLVSIGTTPLLGPRSKMTRSTMHKKLSVPVFPTPATFSAIAAPSNAHAQSDR